MEADADELDRAARWVSTQPLCDISSQGLARSFSDNLYPLHQLLNVREAANCLDQLECLNNDLEIPHC